MLALSAADQLLLAAGVLAERKKLEPPGFQLLSAVEDFGSLYFGRYRLDWTSAPAVLKAQGLAQFQDDQLALTPAGLARIGELRPSHAPYIYAYNEFFYRARRSAAHARFCARVYGRDLCQHGMADMRQIDDLAAALRSQKARDILELGCGNGAVAAYLAEVTGARVTGVDIAEEGIDWARTFARQQPGRLTFLAADMTSVTFPPEQFDALVIVDGVYFVPDLPAFIRRSLAFLKPGGRLYVFFSAWTDSSGPREPLQPEETSFARALRELGLHYDWVDYSADESTHWQIKRQAAAEMQAEFEAEGQGWLYHRRWIEAESHRPYVESGCVRRYRYTVYRPG